MLIMIMDILNVCSLIVATLVLAISTGYWFMFWSKPRGSPPGPPRMPFIGNSVMVDDPNKFLTTLNCMRCEYGDIFSFYFGYKFTVVLNSYKLVKETFVTRGIQFAGRSYDPRLRAVNPYYPHIKGIISESYSEEWKKQRQTALNILRSLGWSNNIIEHRIQDESALMLSSLKDTEAKPFNPAHLLMASASNIICSLLFNTHYKHNDEEFLQLFCATNGFFQNVVGDSNAVFIPILQCLPSFKKSMKKLYSCGNQIQLFYQKQVAEGKKKLAEGKEPGDFVTHYLVEKTKENADISQNWLMSLLFDFFLAGTDTTATTLRWAFLYMSLYPEIQHTIQSEIDSVFGKECKKMSLMDSDKLPYTVATISEIQRIASTLPIAIPHETTADIELGGYMIPKGTQVWPNLYEILHDPKEWPEPNMLKPERFLSEEADKTIRRNHHIPFSMGRRSCLGEQLARQELFIFFTSVLHSFNITLPDEHSKPSTKPSFEFLNKPEMYQVKFHYRL